MSGILAHPATSWSSVSAASVTVLVTVIAALLVGYLLRLAERRLAERPRGLDAAGHTRLRFLRRFVIAVTVLAGFFIALLQFESFDRLASAAIASGAVLSAIIGFSARDSLANAVSGVSMAVTQPLRVGDIVEIGGIRGTVEDVTLTTTWLATADRGRVILPNSVVTSAAVRNDSIGGDIVVPAASAWLQPGADTDAALEAIAAAPEVRAATVAEITVEGVRIEIEGLPVAAAGRRDAENTLRAVALRRLGATGVRSSAAG
ncbi:unannotated protein [freshwater metagenome]|uniref:Unannotated protein n=1 Tax=freshwater metagenome TaxID=449393 RepID=A0A6J7CI61_9ZZZZ|nr:mechanosensitive ion channel [Actinomycetota bacterium]